MIKLQSRTWEPMNILTDAEFNKYDTQQDLKQLKYLDLPLNVRGELKHMIVVSDKKGEKANAGL